MRRDSSFCAKFVRYNIFMNDAPYQSLDKTVTERESQFYAWETRFRYFYERNPHITQSAV